MKVFDPATEPEPMETAELRGGVAVLERSVEPEAPQDLPPDGDQPANVWLICAAVLLSVAAAGWMAGGIFVGLLPRVVGILGAVMGTGVVALSFRTTRPSIVQYLALPFAVVVGALLVLPDASGGTANLPSLVVEAIRTGGIAQPPVPFDPGWRFVIFVLTAFLASGAASLGTAMSRPKLAIALPLPLLVGAALVQPPEATMISAIVALVLLIGALAVSFGVELAREGATSGGFELRRLARGGGGLVVLVAALGVLSQAGFLFPETERDQVIPPKRPEVQPPQADRLLFEVVSESRGPWRLGVLDVYDETAWLLPPYETKRFVDVADGRPLSSAAGEATPTARETFDVTFRMADVEGHVIPTTADPVSVDKRSDFALSFDPRTQMLRLPKSRARRGMAYTVTALRPPTGPELAGAPAPPDPLAEFTRAPSPPLEVQDLLAQAPTSNLWDRLQYVRTAFYQKVVAAGAGQHVDVPPFRVGEMLNGGEATPYEITAAEALLARWAGVPSRVGYGFYAGNRKERDGVARWEVHPRHGATWLEAYFDGWGWVPVIGKPPKAKASTADDQKQRDPDIRPSDELALVVYVPIRLQSIRLLYEVVRYYVGIAVPILLAVAVAWFFFVHPVKVVRRFRRRRWAEAHGPLERVAVEYAEFRDMCTDHGIGDNVLTPLEFVHRVEPDAELRELTWLVTRALWGDLQRDLRVEDAEVAQDMARSVTKRVRGAQPALNRILAMGARTSLRDPYTHDIPNLWPSWAGPGAVRRRLARMGRKLASPLRRLRRLLPIGSAILMIVAGGCGADPAPGRAQLPDPLVPDRLLGYSFEREPEAEKAYARPGGAALVRRDGRVFTIRREGQIVGALQAAVFKDQFRVRDRDTRRDALDSIKENIGSGRFERKRVAGFTVEEMRLPEQRILLWLPGDAAYYQLFVAQQGFAEADRVFAALLAFQRGESAEAALRKTEAELLDPRRGAPQ